MHKLTISTSNFVLNFQADVDLKSTFVTKLQKSLEKTLEVFSEFGDVSLDFNKLNIQTYEVSLVICDDEEIKNLNNDYRSKDKVTDVLSFPVHDSLRPESRDEFLFGPILEIGDIFICDSVTKLQAKEFKITYEQELLHLLVHGFLHLVGFDHELGEIEEKIMFDFEKSLVEKIYKRIGLE